MAAPLRDIERGADAIGELDEATIAVASSPARVAARGAARTRLEAR